MASHNAAVSCDPKQPGQAELDAALEREIDTDYLAYLAAIGAGDADGILDAFNVMRDHVGRRSADQVERMEARLPGRWRS